MPCRPCVDRTASPPPTSGRTTAERRPTVSILDQLRLDGQVAVVTGSGQGIGRAIAWALADAGCDVASTRGASTISRSPPAAFAQRGRRALVAPADIRDFSETLAERDRVRTRRDRRVGQQRRGLRRQERPPARRARRRHVPGADRAQSDSAFQGCKAAAQRMPAGGSIVNITSGAGTRGSPYTGPYAAAKAGLINLTQTLGAGARRARHPGQRRLARARWPPRHSARCSASRTSSTICRERSRSADSERPTTSPRWCCSCAARRRRGSPANTTWWPAGRTQRSYQYEPKDQQAE